MVQGGVLSPILFAAYMDGLFARLRDSGFSVNYLNNSAVAFMRYHYGHCVVHWMGV